MKNVQIHANRLVPDPPVYDDTSHDVLMLVRFLREVQAALGVSFERDLMYIFQGALRGPPRTWFAHHLSQWQDWTQVQREVLNDIVGSTQTTISDK